MGGKLEVIYREYKNRRIPNLVHWAEILNFVVLILGSLSFIGAIPSAIKGDTYLLSTTWIYNLFLVVPVFMVGILNFDKNYKQTNKKEIFCIVVSLLIAVILLILSFLFSTYGIFCNIIVIFVLFIGFITTNVEDNRKRNGNFILFSTTTEKEMQKDKNGKLLITCFICGFFWLDILFLIVCIIMGIYLMFIEFGEGVFLLLGSCLLLGPLSAEGICILRAYILIRKENKPVIQAYRSQLNTIRHNDKLHKIEQKSLERQKILLNSVGKRFFIKYYFKLKSWTEKDIFDIISEDYSEQEKRSRILNGKKIFEEKLNILAIKQIAKETENNIDETTRVQAIQILQQEQRR